MVIRYELVYIPSLDKHSIAIIAMLCSAFKNSVICSGVDSLVNRHTNSSCLLAAHRNAIVLRLPVTNLFVLRGLIVVPVVLFCFPRFRMRVTNSGGRMKPSVSRCTSSICGKSTTLTAAMTSSHSSSLL